MSISGALGAVFGWKWLESSGEVLDNVGEKIFGGSAKAFAEEATAKLKFYTGDIPPNHDLEHAIRISELTSTLVLLGRYKDRKEQERLDRGGLWNEPFVPAARLFLYQQLDKSLGAKTKSDAELVAELDQKLDLAFSEHNAERVRAGLDAAQARVWSDLVAGVGEPPLDFKQLFDGDGNTENPGWALVFVAFMREGLKKSPKAQVAFVASRLGALRETMGALQEKADSIKDDTSALLAFAREAARTRNVAEGFIQEMAARVARDRALDFEGQMRAVREAIEIYEERIAGGLTQTNFGDIVDAALAKAKKQVDEGKSRLADATLNKAAEDLERAEKERRATYVEGVTALRNRQRDIALASYDGEAAAEAVVALAKAVHRADRAGVYKALWAEAKALLEHGRDRGSNVHLIAMIALSRKLLEVASSDDERGGARIFLGEALRFLGERERGTARLYEAAEAFREALKECIRERNPHNWAVTQNNLGNVLGILGERESGTARLDEAVAAFREALKEWTRERVPLLWATTQNNLGAALLGLGRRERGTARLEEAVLAFGAALEERTRERVPLDWATTQNNLANALGILGERERGTARLDEAVAAFREALKEYRRERVPLLWATTQNNLGAALLGLGERESGTAQLEEAVTAFRAALEEWTPEAALYHHDGAQRNLAKCLALLEQRRGS